MEAAPRGHPKVEVKEGRLRGLRSLRVDSLCLVMQHGTGPLHGVLGAIDWRLGGRISEILAGGRFRAHPGEMMLMEGSKQLGIDRLFLSGPRSIRGLTQVLVDAGASSVALVLTEKLQREAHNWLRAMVKAAPPEDGVQRVVFIVPPGRSGEVSL